MKKKKKSIPVILCVVIILGVLSSCSNSNQMKTDEEMRNYGEVMDEAMDYTEIAEDGIAGEVDLASNVNNSEAMISQGRKLIKSISLDVEALVFDELITHIQRSTEELGGYIENSSISGKSYGTDDLRSATLTVRVPVDQMEAFVEDIKSEGNVIYEGENKDDVTLQYTDISSHKAALQTEYDRLLEILDTAETVEDIVAIESRLSEVRYQLEYYESQIRVYDNLIDYGTITLSIIEVRAKTPVGAQGIGSVIKEGFFNSLANIGNGVKGIFINFIIAIPYLAVMILLILVCFLVVRMIKKGRDKNAEKK